MIPAGCTLPGAKKVKVILTVAHLDNDVHNHAVTMDRLKALCQLCHLRLDSKMKAAKRRKEADNSLAAAAENILDFFSHQHFKQSCSHSCSPSDYYPGGKCDLMGCYEKNTGNPQGVNEKATNLKTSIKQL